LVAKYLLNVKPKLNPAVAPLVCVRLVFDENQLIAGSANIPKLIFCAASRPEANSKINSDGIENLFTIVEITFSYTTYIDFYFPL